MALSAFLPVFHVSINASNMAVFLFMGFLSLLVGVNSQTITVNMGPFMEEREAQTYVGNIAKESYIAQEVTAKEFQKLKFEFLDPANKELFYINPQSGTLYCNKMIDRESVCRGKDECIMSFDVTVTSELTDFFRLVRVKLNITDINDNRPSFSPKEMKLEIQENNNAGLTKPLITASDRDAGVNGTVRYSIDSYSGEDQGLGPYFEIDSVSGEIYVAGEIDFERVGIV